MAASNPKLFYLPFAGRGELSKLIAAAGGLSLDEEILPMDGDRKELVASCGGVATGVPVLIHGDLKMCQSQAIQGYLALIAPKFASLSPQARAVDLMWASHMEEGFQDYFKSGITGYIFPPREDALTDEMKGKCKEALEKWFGLFEKLSPESGFVNKEAFPTGADCVAVYFYYAAAPYRVLYALSGFDTSKYPKFKALADRGAAAEGLKEHVASGFTMSSDPFEDLYVSKRRRIEQKQGHDEANEGGISAFELKQAIQEEQQNINRRLNMTKQI